MDRIKKDDGCALIAVKDNKVVGYIIGGITYVEYYRNIDIIAEAESMFILEENRGSGVGKKLLQEFTKWCKHKNVNRVKAVASSQNKRAIEFYRREGFEDYDLVLEKDL